MKKITEEIEKSVKKYKGEDCISPLEVANFLYPQIKKFSNYSDSTTPERNVLLEYMLTCHIMEDSKYLYQWVSNAHETMKSKKIGGSIHVGDMDVYLTILVRNSKKVVFHVRNTCSCADVVDWIVIWDRSPVEESIHVRQIHAKSDYPKSQYPQKLGLKFYKDRKYNMEFDKELHMTKLGSVYGDIRDSGYIVSIKRYLGEWSDMNRAMSPISESLFHFYNDYTHAMYNFRWIAGAFNDDQGS